VSQAATPYELSTSFASAIIVKLHPSIRGPLPTNIDSLLGLNVTVKAIE